MYIEPNTTIQLFKNLRLDAGYTNTMWFSSLSAQNSFFSGLTKTTLSNNYYQRKDKGVLKVGVKIEDGYDFTYMRFINSSFENKWFYAFVNKVEYVNNATIYVYYTIDVIQTYMHDWEMHTCLVERQHSTTDVAGDNLEAEGLDIGDVIADGAYLSESIVFNNISNYHAYLWLADDGSGGLASRPILAGMPTGIYYVDYPCTTAGINGLITRLDTMVASGKTDNILNITIMPDSFAPESSTPETPRLVSRSFNKPTSINGYTPTNQKLLTYPYCYLCEYNDQNESIDLRYEMFTGSSCGFSIYGVLSPTGEIISVPNYDGNTQNIKYGLSISGFPQVSYSTSGYKAWLAMNYDQTELSRNIGLQQYTIDMNRAESSKTLANTSAVGDMITNFVDLQHPLSFIGNTIKEAGKLGTAEYDYFSVNVPEAELSKYKAVQSANIAESVAKKLPTTPHAGSTSCAVSISKKGIYFQRMGIRRQFAEKVDKYFSMFGYAQNKVMTPNYHARSQYTFVKTSGCSISGSIPQDDKKAINQIFDSGIRFWVNYSNFEDYSVTNSIL